MLYPLDIFKTPSDGGVLWRGAAENLVAAKACIKKFAVSSPGEYLVLDQKTGKSVRIMGCCFTRWRLNDSNVPLTKGQCFCKEIGGMPLDRN